LNRDLHSEGTDCAVCARLHREYESALLALVRAESQLQVAGFSSDIEAKRALEQVVERLAADRQASRKILRDHEVSAHGGEQPQANSA
jgi:hypothetical protein